MEVLVRTPAPHATESMLGYVLRISETNGYDTPWHVLSTAGIQRDHSYTAGFPARKLAAALGLAVTALDGLAYARSDGNAGYQLLGQELGRSQRTLPLRLTAPKICVQCVEEHGFIDAFWDLAAAFACPVHRREALRHCPACEQKLKWARPGLLTCRCGASLAEVETAPVPDEVASLMDVLMAKLHGRSLAALDNAAGLPVERMEIMSFKDLYSMLQAVGKAWARLKGLRCSNEGGEDDRAWRTVASALAQWPNGYHAFLRGLGEDVFGNRQVSGLVKQFLPFYDPVLKRRVHEWQGSFLREEFFRFGAQEWGHALPDLKTLRAAGQLEDAEQGRFLSKSAYARKHGISKPTLERLLANGSISSARVGTGRGARHVVDLAGTVAPRRAEGLLTERQAAAALGLPVSVLRHLREWGVFEVPPRLGYSRAWYHEDVDAFVQRVMGMVPSPAVDANGTVLGDVMRKKFGDDAVKARIVEAVVQGTIALQGATGPTLASVVVDRAALRRFTASLQVQTARADISVNAVAKATGLDPATVPHIVAAGWLKNVGDSASPRISAASVREFCASFATLASVADACHTTTVSLRRTCDELEIGVIELRCERQGGRARVQPIVRRSDADKLLEVRMARDHDKERRRAERVGRVASYECALRAYLSHLVANDERLPLRGGKPNRALIARKSGFGRDVFYAHASVQALLDAFVAETTVTAA